MHNWISSFWGYFDVQMIHTYEVTNTGDEIINEPITMVEPTISVKICPSLITVGNLDGAWDKRPQMVRDVTTTKKVQ